MMMSRSRRCNKHPRNDGRTIPSEEHNWLVSGLFVTRICCCSVAKSCLTLLQPHELQHTNFSVLPYLSELAQTHVHWVGDAIQPSHPLSSPSPPALNLLQHQGLFQWVDCSHQMAKVLEFQLQHQSFQSIGVSASASVLPKNIQG